MRKEQKKRYSLREGSKYEEEGLLHASHEIYTKVKVLAEDVKLTISILTRISCDEEAKKLQNDYSDVVKELVSLKQSIWSVPTEGQFDLVTALSPNIQSLEDLKVFVPPEFDLKLCTKLHLHS
jgi:elongator complex protein 1